MSFPVLLIHVASNRFNLDTGFMEEKTLSWRCCVILIISFLEAHAQNFSTISSYFPCCLNAWEEPKGLWIKVL